MSDTSSTHISPDDRRNYRAHLLEGGFFLGGVSFVHVQTVLPPMLEDMQAPQLLISLAPTLMSLGFILPSLFTAHYIERLHNFLPTVLWVSVFQRLPYLLVGLALVLLGTSHMSWLVFAVAATPLLSGIMGGVTATAWQQLVAKTVPAHRRAGLFSQRNIFASLCGLVGAAGVEWILRLYPGSTGYGLLHLVAFVGLVLSYIILARVKEVPHDPAPKEDHLSLWQNWRTFPGLILGDKQLSWFVVSRITLNGMFVLTPVLSLHALAVLNKAQNFVGSLLMAQMVGTLVGNALAGVVGDRWGTKHVMIGGRVVFLIAAIVFVGADTSLAFFAAFFLYGLSFDACIVGGLAMSLEILPKKNRASVLALIMALGAPGMLLAGALSNIIMESTGDPRMAGWISMGIMALSLVSVFFLKEPRKRST